MYGSTYTYSVSHKMCSVHALSRYLLNHCFANGQVIAVRCGNVIFKTLFCDYLYNNVYRYMLHALGFGMHVCCTPYKGWQQAFPLYFSPPCTSITRSHVAPTANTSQSANMDSNRV